MLNQILNVIAGDEARTRQDIVAALDAPEPLVIQMIERLTQEGYLTEASQCASGCEGCSLAKACGGERSLKIWTLTEKGARAVERG